MSKYSTKLLVVVILVTNYGCASNVTNVQESVSTAQLEHGLKINSMLLNGGVEILSIRLTAKNHMLRLRYKVIDEEKARPILNRQNKPYIIIEKSGNRLHVPNTAKLGALRQSTPNPKLNRVYSAMFKNYSYLVKLGDTVTLVIGDYRVENIPVS